LEIERFILVATVARKKFGVNLGCGTEATSRKKIITVQSILKLVPLNVPDN